MAADTSSLPAAIISVVEAAAAVLATWIDWPIPVKFANASQNKFQVYPLGQQCVANFTISGGFLVIGVIPLWLRSPGLALDQSDAIKTNE